jgi:prepilin-type N-terminal cleavage/methylation domain-containing protein
MAERRRDRGFTLPEVLIVVVLIGVLAGAIAAVFSIIVRTTPSTEARVDDARSLLGVTTWFPPDVNSTPQAPAPGTPYWDTDSMAASGCTGVDPGTSIVRLQWSEQTGGSPTTFVANYRLAADGDGGSTLYRIACSNGGSPTQIAVARQLPDPSTNPVVAGLTNDGGQIVGMFITVTTADGDTLRLDAQSNNPQATLGTVPTESTVAATTTTSTSTTTTTTVAPSTSVSETTTTTAATTTTTTTTTLAPCVADFSTGNGANAPVRPSPVENQGKKEADAQFGPLQESVTVKVVKVSGGCAGLRLEFVRAPGGEIPERVPVSLSFGSADTIILGPEPTERWEDGDRVLRLFDVNANGGVGGYIGRTEILEVT